MMEDHWKCQNCGNSVPDGLTVCPKCGLVKGGFDELPEQTADGLEIARVEQKVKVEIPFILDVYKRQVHRLPYLLVPY